MSVGLPNNQFAFLGKDLAIEDGVVINNSSKTWIGNNVRLGSGALLTATHSKANESQTVRIKVGDRSFIGRNTILESFNQINVEEDVMIGPRVYLSDSQHEYSNPLIPPIFQGIQNINNVLLIQRGAWIGHSATLIGNITIGYGSVVGANSVVTFDVPSHCVIFGNPASILKIYHYTQKKWVRPKSQDELIDLLETRGDFGGYDDKVILKALQDEIAKMN